jgi:molybdopterin molybdotransferase
LTRQRIGSIMRGVEELDVSDLLTVTQAIAILDRVPVTPRVVIMPLREAQGLRLAQDVRTDRDFPAFDKSQMDGYAVRCEDVAKTPVELRVVGEITAGTSSDKSLEAGEAVAIMTGAPMPPGADGVVPIEETERVEDRVKIKATAVRGRYVAAKGSDAKAGTVVLSKGMALKGPQIAVAAACGAARVEVCARPKVAVLSTGDELVDVDATPGPSQIRNSNSPMLVALLRDLGCEVTDLGNAVDTPEQIKSAIEGGFNHDAIFITGGMSMGTRDYAPQVIRELGFDLKITKLRIKPGKPFIFGTRESESARFVFGLPGNPVSGFVCTVRLAARFLARLAGGEPHEKWQMARLAVGLSANGPREFYQPVIWSPLQGGTSARSEFPLVTPLAWKGSADLFTLAKANALLVRPENEPPLGKGTVVRVLEI